MFVRIISAYVMIIDKVVFQSPHVPNFWRGVPRVPWNWPQTKISWFEESIWVCICECVCVWVCLLVLVYVCVCVCMSVLRIHGACVCVWVGEVYGSAVVTPHEFSIKGPPKLLESKLALLHFWPTTDLVLCWQKPLGRNREAYFKAFFAFYFSWQCKN